MSDFWIKVQGGINSLDDGGTHFVLRIVLFLFLGASLAGGIAWTQFRGLDNADAMEYAQLGHNLAEGKGFVTSCIRPVDFRQLGIDAESGVEISALPELRKGPVYPFLLAFGFKVINPAFTPPAGGKLFAPESKVILPIGIIFLLMTALVVFFLALKLFNQKIAILSMLLVLINGTLLSSVISGTPIPVAIFLISAIMLVVQYAASAYTSRKSWKLWLSLVALAGLLFGLVFLTLYAMIALLPMLLVWLWFSFEDKRWPVIILFVGVFMLCVTPWLLRNQAVSGTPFGLAPSQVVHDTYMYHGDSYDRELAPELSNSITAMAIKNKFKRNLSKILNDNLGLGGLGIIGAFFLVSFLTRVEVDEKNLLKWSTLIGVLFIVIIIGLCGMEKINLMTVFFPIMIIFGVAFFCSLADHLTNYAEEGYEAVPGAILIIIAALPVLLTVIGTRGSIPYPPYYPPLVSFAANMLNDDELLCTDIPWATAWYGNHTSVLLPGKVSDLAAMSDFGWKCSGIYLADKSAAGSYAEDLSWQALRQKEVPVDFALQHGIYLPPGSKDQLFLTDNVRWGSSE